MTKKEMDKIGMEFAKALGQVFIKSTKMKMADGIAIIDHTTAPFLKAATKSPDFLQELARRVAENKLLLSDEQKRPFAEVDSYYKALCKLGFTDIAKKVTYTIIFARYCLRHDNIEKGINLLKKLQRETNNHARFYQELKADVDKAMETAKAAKKGTK